MDISGLEAVLTIADFAEKDVSYQRVQMDRRTSVNALSGNEEIVDRLERF